jgi:hypothetical protein
MNKYSPKLQRQAMHVYNSTYEKLLKETGSLRESKNRATMAMNSVLKKRFKKRDSMENNTREDYFSHLVDSFLNNLHG